MTAQQQQFSEPFNFDEFFRKEQPVWLMNTKPNTVLSIDYPVGHGQPPIHDAIPFIGDPIRVMAPWDAIKNAMVLRHVVNAGHARVMTEDEAMAHFDRRAKTLSLSGGRFEAMQKARERYDMVKNRRKAKSPADRLRELPKTAQELDAMQTPGPTAPANEPIRIDEAVTPRILQICQDAHPSLPEGERRAANEILAELDAMRDVLKDDDLEHLRAHGGYRSVNAWAQTLQKERAEAALTP